VEQMLDQQIEQLEELAKEQEELAKETEEEKKGTEELSKEQTKAQREVGGIGPRRWTNCLKKNEELKRPEKIEDNKKEMNDAKAGA
jgi:hypothetical protein